MTEPETESEKPWFKQKMILPSVKAFSSYCFTANNRKCTELNYAFIGEVLPICVFGKIDLTTVKSPFAT